MVELMPPTPVERLQGGGSDNPPPSAPHARPPRVIVVLPADIFSIFPKEINMAKKDKPALPGFDGPRKTALESIRLFCVQCMGGSPSLVTDCPSSNCVLYPYRSGAIADGASRRLLKVIKTFCDGCAPCGDVAGCTASRCYLSLDPCPVWPFRNGTNPYIGRVQREKLRQHAQKQLDLVGREARFRPRLNETTSTHTSGQPVETGGSL